MFLSGLINDIRNLGQHPQQSGPIQQPAQRQFQSIVPFQNNAQGIAAAAATPGYQQAAANEGQQLSVQPQLSRGNLGAPYMYDSAGNYSVGQGGLFNPGYTPMQNSGFGPGGNPQIGAFQDQPGQLNSRGFNPQDNYYQQYWF